MNLITFLGTLLRKKTSIDCFEKRGKKGYLFTIGDEQLPPTLTKAQIG